MTKESLIEKLEADISVILNEAQKHGTTHRLKSVAIYFSADELTVILACLRQGEAWGNIWAFEPYMKAFLPRLKQSIDLINGIPGKNQESRDVAITMLARDLADTAVKIGQPAPGLPKIPAFSEGWRCANCGGAHGPQVVTCPEGNRNDSLRARLRRAQNGD